MANTSHVLPQLAAADGAATAVGGAATLNAPVGVITTESLTQAAGADYTLTLTNSFIQAGSNVLVTVEYGTNTNVVALAIKSVTPAAGSVTIVVRNANSAAVALNGTLKIRFLVV